MKPVQFPEANMVYAENQPPYLPLPAWRGETESITCWWLTLRERLTLLFTGRLWLRQLHFGKTFPPQVAQVAYPFHTGDENPAHNPVRGTVAR